MIKAYYYLTKPGIIYGNSLSVIAGFFLASHGVFNPLLFLATLLGISFVIASACVFNNYIDRDIDEKMQRTKNRALAKKTIPVTHALIYGSLLSILGFGLLLLFTNLLTTFIAFVGFFFYVVLYSIYKRKSVYGTLVGSVSGAVPPVVGYCAVSNSFDMGAFLLFVILVVWQMPHFYAIAIFRSEDYAAASIPVLPLKQGIKTTQHHMLFYIVAFIIATACLTFVGLASHISLLVMLLLGLWWFSVGLQGFKASDSKKWARKMFGVSLLVLTIFCVMISIDSLLSLL